MALFRYADREGFYAGQAKQELGVSSEHRHSHVL
jgi:hypothetical protein